MIVDGCWCLVLGEWLKRIKNSTFISALIKSALSLHEISKNFPKDELFGLTAQMRRSSKGICANLAEGFAKSPRSSAEFKRFVSMAVGSSQETKVWLDFAIDLGYLAEEEANRLIEQYDIISKQLYTMMDKWK